MHSLETINALNSRPKVHTPWNRDSSCLKSRGGYVIHSALHRSTAFVDPDEHAETFKALLSIAHNRKALNAFIPAIIGGYSVRHALKLARKS